MTKISRGTAYEVFGQGPPVLLVHGLGMNRQMWQWQRPALEPWFRVITYDLYGHGETIAPPREPDLRLFSEQIEQLLDDLEIACCAVVGFSLGGMIARRFAFDDLSRLSALVVLNSAHDRTDQERGKVLARAAEAKAGGPQATIEGALDRWFSPNFRAQNGDTMALIRRWVMANDPEIYPLNYQVLAEGDREIAQGLERIICPALIMTGSDDSGNTPDMTRRMAAAMNQAEAVVLPGHRHMGLAEDPKAVNDRLLPFLRRHLGRPETGRAEAGS